MATSCAVQLTPKNGVTEENDPLATWPDAATEVFLVPSQVNTTSLVPPVKPPSGASIVKLLLTVPTIPRLMLKLALNAGNGPSTIPKPLIPSPFQSLDI